MVKKMKKASRALTAGKYAYQFGSTTVKAIGYHAVSTKIGLLGSHTAMLFVPKILLAAKLGGLVGAAGGPLGVVVGAVGAALVSVISSVIVHYAIKFFKNEFPVAFEHLVQFKRNVKAFVYRATHKCQWKKDKPAILKTFIKWRHQYYMDSIKNHPMFLKEAAWNWLQPLPNSEFSHDKECAICNQKTSLNNPSHTCRRCGKTVGKCHFKRKNVGAFGTLRQRIKPLDRFGNPVAPRPNFLADPDTALCTDCRRQFLIFRGRHPVTVDLPGQPWHKSRRRRKKRSLFSRRMKTGITSSSDLTHGRHTSTTLNFLRGQSHRSSHHPHQQTSSTIGEKASRNLRLQSDSNPGKATNLFFPGMFNQIDL